MYGFMFNTSMKEKKNKREEYLEKRKEAKKEKTVSFCYLMVNQQTTKTTQSHSLWYFDLTRVFPYSLILHSKNF
jgi:hypothetical protein